MTELQGLGDGAGVIRVYIANRPSFTFSQQNNCIAPLQQGEINAVGQACGNGWRKVFNVYAKLIYALSSQGVMDLTQHKFASWQAYRDKRLLQQGSATALLFGPSGPDFSCNKTVHIVAGRTYANSLNLPPGLVWLDREFAIDKHNKLIVCPYFDYRQLSNSKIIHLIELIAQLGLE